MANGVIVESRIQATNIDALNRTAQAQTDVAGGGLIGYGSYTLLVPRFSFNFSIKLTIFL